MNKNYNNNNFIGKLFSKSCYDYYNNLKSFKKGKNEKITIENINKLLGYKDEVDSTDKFWEYVFLQNDEDNFKGGINLILNNNTSLYTDSNIGRTLELMGSIIISSSPKNEDTIPIKIFSNKQLFKKALKEQEDIDNISKDATLIYKADTNYKEERHFVNLDDKELEKVVNLYKSKAPVIIDYYNAYNVLIENKNNLAQLKKEGKITPEQQKELKGICNLLYSYKVDIIDIIEQQVQPIRFKDPLPDMGKPSWECFDELDKDQLKPLLQVHKSFTVDDDLSYIVSYLDKVILECKFTEYQEKILNLYRDGHSPAAISKLLNISQGAVHQRIKSILTIIFNKMYSNYEDWYYLNISKGQYKKCKQCGEVKLISKFTKYKGTCKECRNSKNKKKFKII